MNGKYNQVYRRGKLGKKHKDKGSARRRYKL